MPDDRPATKRQEQLIRSLVRDFPDSKELLEYADWQMAPTKVHASAFITTALECNWEQANRSDVYLKYIATRPRVERLGSHGLFGDDDSVDLQRAAAELDSYTGNVWTHIISLKREDAARLGYDHAPAWRDLLRQERNEIAVAMGIPPDHFRWYAAFHDEGDHPHVHMVAWSSQPKEGWLDRDGIRKIKSTLGDKVVSRVTAQDIQKLYTKLKKEGRVHEHPEHGHKLSDTMVRRVHAMLHRCLRDAEAAHVIPRNPATGAVLPKASAKSRQILTREQMQTFLASVDGNEVWRDFFYVDLVSGPRQGELISLPWAAVPHCN